MMNKYCSFPGKNQDGYIIFYLIRAYDRHRKKEPKDTLERYRVVRIEGVRLMTVVNRYSEESFPPKGGTPKVLQ